MELCDKIGAAQVGKVSRVWNGFSGTAHYYKGEGRSLFLSHPPPTTYRPTVERVRTIGNSRPSPAKRLADLPPSTILPLL
ncbi:hypothetical protein OPQ81_009467 [Rhizoctonia solani]|nr:hypothetical protein OPQ81_009467 [Rhizoctonia solani]